MTLMQLAAGRRGSCSAAGSSGRRGSSGTSCSSPGTQDLHGSAAAGSPDASCWSSARLPGSRAAAADDVRRLRTRHGSAAAGTRFRTATTVDSLSPLDSLHRIPLSLSLLSSRLSLLTRERAVKAKGKRVRQEVQGHGSASAAADADIPWLLQQGRLRHSLLTSGRRVSAKTPLQVTWSSSRVCLRCYSPPSLSHSNAAREAQPCLPKASRACTQAILAPRVK